MKWELTWGGDPEDLLVTTSGAATLDGLAAYMQAGLDDERYRPDLRVIIDHRELSFAHFTRADIERRVEAIVRQRRDDGPKVAVVVGPSVDFGLVRMLGTMVKSRTGDEYTVFYTLAEARAWLRDSD